MRVMWLNVILILSSLHGILCPSNEVTCEDGDCRLQYEEWVIGVEDGALAARNVAKCMGMKLVHAVSFIEEQHPLVRSKRSNLPTREDSSVHWNDPLYDDMWYITRQSRNGGYDMNVQEAWQLGYTGKGVTLSIMDDGIDYTHTDLKQNYDPEASYDWNDHDVDPMPNLLTGVDNKHGTRCAGQIAAQGNNSVCMVGIAYNARIGGIRMLDGYITDRLESESLGFRNDHIDIYSGSWGPEDTGKLYEGPGTLAQSAFQKGVASGRKGFGNIYVWASGNGGISGDSCACDGYASSPFTLSVSGVGERNGRPWYLEQCSSTLVTTYSSGGPSEKMISTLDPQQKCTTKHTGTSASAPMAAGIIALLLEANNRLSWRDVQYITLLTANPLPFIDGNFTTNAAGRQYSQLYGYGLMDAGKMVRLGELWRGLPMQHKCTSKVANVKQRLTGRFNHTFRIKFSGCLPVPRSKEESYEAYLRNTSEVGDVVRYLEHVQLYADVEYSWRGLLQISLISPSGTLTVLQPPRIYDEHSGSTGLLTWPLTTVQLWGESAQGEWQVRVDNMAGSNNQQTGRHIWNRPNLDTANGDLHSVWLVTHGTEEFPIRLRPPRQDRPHPPLDWYRPFAPYVVADSQWHKVYTCHPECAPGGCSGPASDQCLGGCLHYATQSRQCVPSCPPGTTPHGAVRVLASYSSSRSDGVTLGSSQGSRVRPRPRPLSRQRSSNLENEQANVVCQPCWTLCGGCVRPHTEYDCTSCSNGRLLVPLITPSITNTASNSIDPVERRQVLDIQLPSIVGTCRTECPDGFYANRTTSTCNLCSDNCVQCFGSQPGQCRLCQKGYRLVHGRCVDGASVNGRCPLGQYMKQSHCVPCDAGCAPEGCLGDGQCILCNVGFPYLFQSTCVQSCPAGWIASSEHLPQPFGMQSSPAGSISPLVQCEPCGPGCLGCTGPGRCTTCVEGLKLDPDGKCVRQDESTDIRCNSPCNSCLVNPDNCLTCQPDHSQLVQLPGTPRLERSRRSSLTSPSQAPLSLDTKSSQIQSPPYTCTATCPEATYSGFTRQQVPACFACPPSCLSCKNATHCLTCHRTTFHMDKESGLCLRSIVCRKNEYFDRGQKACLPCDPSCATCIGPLTTECTSCSFHSARKPRCWHMSLDEKRGGGGSTAAAASGSINKATMASGGRCVRCCAYEQALISRKPHDCMFCVAHRETCLAGNEIHAGEGLVLEDTSTRGHSTESDSNWNWRSRVMSYVFPILVVILLIILIVFIVLKCLLPRLELRPSVHGRRTLRWRTSSATSTVARQRRQRNAGSTGNGIKIDVDDFDDAERISLKQGDERAFVERDLQNNNHPTRVEQGNHVTSNGSIALGEVHSSGPSPIDVSPPTDTRSSAAIPNSTIDSSQPLLYR